MDKKGLPAQKMAIKVYAMTESFFYTFDNSITSSTQYRRFYYAFEIDNLKREKDKFSIFGPVQVEATANLRLVILTGNSYVYSFLTFSFSLSFSLLSLCVTF